MKIAGQKLSRPAAVPLVIPRADGDIVFMFDAVLDFSEFDKMFPRVEPPKTFNKDGSTALNVEDPEYLKSLNTWASARTKWTVLKSMQATPNLEFETVNINDPTTYENFDSELRAAGFSMVEIGKFYETAFLASGLNDDKIEEATKRFLATRSALGS